MQRTGFLLCFLVLASSFAAAAAPVVNSFSIAGNAPYTQSATPSLDSDVTGAVDMNFSCNGTDYNTAVPYAASYSGFDYNVATNGCTPGDGTKTVYVKYSDGDGNISPASDTIVFDTTAPAISNRSPADGGTGGANATISADASDVGSGIDTNTNKIIMAITGTAGNIGTYVYGTHPDIAYSGTQAAGTVTFTPSSPFTSGTVTVDLTVTDRVGDFNNIVWSFTVDATAPADVAGLAAHDQNNGTDVKLEWAASPEADFNNYKVYKDTNPITDVSAITAIASTGDVNQYTAGALAAGTTYYFAVTAVDDAGNEKKTSPSTVSIAPINTIAPAAPTGLSASAGDSQVTLNWSANSEGDLASYKVYKDGTFWTTLTGTPPGTSVAVTGLSNGTAYAFKVSAVDNNNNESAYSSEVSATPSSSAPTQCSDGTALSTCSATKPNYCDGSGSLSARCDLCSCPSGYTCNSDNTCSAQATTCSDGTAKEACSATKPQFCNANLSLADDCITCGCDSGYLCDADTEQCVKQTQCAVTVTMKINGAESPAYAPMGYMDVDVESAGGNLYDAALRVYLQGKGYEPDLDSGDGVGSLAGSYYVDEDAERILVELVAADSAGVACGERVWMDVDTNKPGLEVFAPEAGEKISGKYTITAAADDMPSGIKSVDFYYKQAGSWVKITGMSVSADRTYSYPWDTAKAENGAAELKAVAKDKAGNASEVIVDIEIRNELTAEDEAAAALGDARAEAEDAAEALESFEGFAVLPKELQGMIDDAEANLQKAESAEEEGEYATAETYAKRAAAKYKAIAGYMSASVFKEVAGSIERETAGASLAAAGLEAGLASEAADALGENTVARKLVISKVTMDGRTFYKAAIVITVKNDSNSEKGIKVIEVVPKEFAQSASALESSAGFATLQQDPVISFSIESIAAGKEAVLVYGLAKELSLEEAEALAVEATLANFRAPPAILGIGADLGGSFGGFGNLFSGLAGLFSGFGVLDLFGTLVIGLIIVAVVLAAVVLYVFVNNKGDFGFGGGGSETPLLGAMRRTGRNPLGGLGEKLSSIGRGSERPRRGRFAWKD